MVRPLKIFTLGLSVLGTIGVASLSLAPSASAFTLLGDGSFGIDANDVDKEFTVNFDGNVSENDVTGLSSEAVFKFLGFSSLNGKTEATFDITLKNTSTDGITSRTSALGFDVWNFDGEALGSKLDLLGVGNQSGSGRTRVEGLFTNDRSGSFPNQFGAIDVCFTNGNTCQGGASGGVTTDNSGTFKATLAFSGDVEQFALNNFGVRYQSINSNVFNGASGTGRGTVEWDEPETQPREIPEPTTATALLLVGLGASRYVKRKQQLLLQNEA